MSNTNDNTAQPAPVTDQTAQASPAPTSDKPANQATGRVLPDLTQAPTSTDQPAKGKKARKAKKAKGAGDEGGKKASRRSIVPARFKERYAKHDDSCGDRVAAALKKATTTQDSEGRDKCDLKALKEIATANGVWNPKYASLNAGQQRMNVGNRLRGMIKNDETVTIGSTRYGQSGLVKVEAKAKASKEKPAATGTAPAPAQA